MAEYIDRTQLALTPIDITDLPTDKCLMVYLAEDVDFLPTANVIERSKIDKAIEEIEGEYSTCNQDWIDGLNRALEILKRNIGGSMNECDEISNEAYSKISAHCEILGTCKDCLVAEEINESTIWCVYIHSYPEADFYCKYYKKKEK